MPAQRIDFKHVRQNGDFSKVLKHYGIALEKDGPRDGQFKCLCPFHDDQKPSCKINTQKNIFHCFVCDAGGNMLDFVMEMDGVAIREAARQIAEWSGIAAAPGQPTRTSKPERNARDARRGTPGAVGAAKQVHLAKAEKEAMVQEQAEEASNEGDTDGVAFNRPLTFRLQNLVADHPFFEERGLTPDMIKTFGLGIATRGIMKDRLVFPIHNRDGELVAYCGRYLGNEIPDGVPKYKQPANFRKELELFNWHRVKDDVTGDTPVVLVEGFFSVVKLFPAYPVVSPMGRSLSARQTELLKSGGVTSVVVLFDGDDPGRTAVTTVGRQLLAEGFHVMAPVVREDFKPHRCTSDELARILGQFL